MDADTPKFCPKCGKVMEEALKFKGLWVCPDNRIRLNDRAPFRFKCDGMELTDEGARELEEALEEVWMRHVRESN